MVETQGQMLATVMAGKYLKMRGEGLTPPQCLLPESKQNQTGINKHSGLPRNGDLGACTVG